MSAPHHSRRGSMGYSPRKRARSEVPHIKSWPDIDGSPKLQGFAGYKAGMTHAMIVDYRKSSTTAGKLVRIPITVVEVPPLKVFGVRFYEKTPYGQKLLTEIWADELDPRLAARFPLPKNAKKSEEKWEEFMKKNIEGEVEDVRVLAHTQPAAITGVPKKAPEVMEIRVGGGTILERIDYARSILGKSVSVARFARDGDVVDVLSVTKGKGFQGAVKRWGLKLLTHKNSKHRRMIGNQGPFTPGYIRSTVPQAGQTGYHQRTEFNKRIVRIVRVKNALLKDIQKSKESKKEGKEKKDSRFEEMLVDKDVHSEDWQGDPMFLWKTAEGDNIIWKDNPAPRLNSMRSGKEGKGTQHRKKSKMTAAPKDDGITPRGGFLNYGVVSTDYILIHGSIPGPAKRLVKLRDPVRAQFRERLAEPPEIVFISRESKQGV